MKKMMLVIMSCMLMFAITAFTFSTEVDAKARGSFKSPAGSFKQPTKPAPAKDTNVSKTTPTTTTSAKPGFFSGGGLMRGLMIGGIAGMLFGGMFGGLGFMGDILGLLINVIAIFAVIMLIRMAVLYFIKRRNENEPKRY